MTCTLARTDAWFKAARPVTSLKDQNAQLGVHLEEVAEMLEAVDGTNVETNRLLGDAELALKNLADHLKANSSDELLTITSPVLFLDALCDQVVTATGVAHTHRYDFVGAMAEVNASNFSKFDADGNPIYNEAKKIMKGPSYFKAELSRFLPAE